jgi:hypothetical protein
MHEHILSIHNPGRYHPDWIQRRSKRWQLPKAVDVLCVARRRRPPVVRVTRLLRRSLRVPVMMSELRQKRRRHSSGDGGGGINLPRHRHRHVE